MRLQHLNFSRYALTGVLALLAGILLVLSAPAQAQTITAKPQAVTIPAAEDKGSSVIAWDAGAIPKAEVRLQIDGGDEERFSDKAKGTQAAVIEAGKTYTFKLYKDENGEELLASVVVTGKKAAGGAANTAEAPDVAAAVSFTGTWKTVAGGGNSPFTVTLEQTGNKVTGTYSPGNGKIFNGVVVGRKVTFDWTQDGGWEGTGEWTMDEDGKGFTGTSTSLKPRQFTHNWSTPRKPVSSFAGKWDTVSSNDAKYLVILQQTGNKVTGTYSPNNGKIEGTVTGRILRFKWSNTGGQGSGRFVMNDSGQTFSGSYTTGDNPDDADGTWNGKRYVASFSGGWKAVTTSSLTLSLYLKQDGDQVTGQIFTTIGPGAKPIYQLKEGTVVGNTLRFKVVSDGKEVGTGELVMDEDEKSFKGTIVDYKLTGIAVQLTQFKPGLPSSVHRKLS